MRIALLDHYAGSLQYGMEFRPYYMAREWVRMGHEVYIIAGDYSHLRIKNPDIQKDFAEETVDGIKYIWLRTGKYEGNGVARALTMFRYVMKLIFHSRALAKRMRCDAIISSSTYPLDNYAARAIARHTKARVVHEAHDLWPLTLTEIYGMGKHHPFVMLLQAAENSAYKHSDAVVCLFPNALEHMMAHKLGERAKYNYIPNGICEDDWRCPDALPALHSELISSLREIGQPIVLYCGSLGHSNAMETFIDAASLCANAAFVLVGNGTALDSLKARAADKSNVYFLPAVPKKAVPNVLDKADVLYMGALPSPLYAKGVSFNKLYDYMMSGRAIIYGADVPNDEVAEAGCGITIKPSDTIAIKNAVDTLAAMSAAQRDQLGQNGRRWVRAQRNYTVLAGKFLEVLCK